MKFKVTMKDPGALDLNPEDFVYETAEDMSNVEIMATAEERAFEAGEFAGKWMRHGEYLTVEFDTDAGTCTVVKP